MKKIEVKLKDPAQQLTQGQQKGAVISTPDKNSQKWK